ncbi:ABC transporter substrate-binding protein [Pseudooceanicola lipolyticus]|uniref:ABC transporter substrate-binding protein n=1 Tax=Pseudooceanicola lipolyticus TaxID=2029104 RepID=A0A2M8J1T8_9RHOB|nr:ABC transporter substrate-binding protein [Pseudooceanicola lipolyticus]PJE36735.1 ABC transporter substrate-binding protein [Pseudooceanicola lipolyticus]
MTRFLTATTAIAALTAGSQAVQADDLVVGMFGGSFGRAAQTCHIAPFETATGDTVIVQEGSSSQFAAMVRATGGDSDFDVVYIDNSFAAQLAAENLLQQLDKSKLSHAGELVDGAFGADDHFVQYQWGATALAYNPADFDTPPDSWADVFEQAANGKVALPDIAGTAGVHFLIAAALLNGGDIDNLDPGFEAIAKIAPNVKAYYTQADQIISMFERGEISIAPWYPDRAASAADAGIPVAIAYPEEGAIGIKVTMVIPEGAANPDGAYAYVDGALSAEVQKCFAENMYAGPVNTNVTLDGAAANAVPPEMFGKLYFPDPEKIAANVGDWRARWQREITN